MAEANNKAKYRSLAGNFRFRVFIDGRKLAFSRISGLGGAIDREVYTEGGGEGYSHLMQKPSTQVRSVAMERGLQLDGSDLVEKIRPGIYIPTAQILLLDKRGNITCEYNLEELLVTKWETGEMDGLSGKIMLDTFEMDYVRMSRKYYG